MTKQKYKQYENFSDRHHIGFERTMWYANKPAKKIRQTPEMIARLERPVHVAIHENCPIVPILGHHGMLRVVKHWEVADGDVLGTVDNLMFAVEKAIKHPRTHELERNLGGLMVQALEMQKPFLRDNIITDQERF